MSVIISSNKIAIPEHNKTVAKAVVQGIGLRPYHDDWQISIFEPIDIAKYIITIQGPNNFRWERDFFGPTEQRLDFICEEVRKATQYAP